MPFTTLDLSKQSGTSLPSSIVTASGLSTALTPSWFVRRTLDQNLTNNTFTKVEWNVEDIDTDSAFASNKFTVPSGKNGKYYIEANVAIYDMATQEHHYVEIRKNGSAVSARPTGITTQADDTDRYMQHISGIFDLAVSDYIEIYAYVYTSGVDSTATMNESWFSGFKIG